MLTESGLQWEVLLIDAASDDGTVFLLRRWCEGTGFRMAASSAPIHRAEAIVTGLTASRGDVTIVIDANARYRMSLLRQAITRWKAGAQVVFATHEDGDRIVVPEHESMGACKFPADVIDTCDFGEAVGGFVLLDKCIVRRLLDGE